MSQEFSVTQRSALLKTGITLSAISELGHNTVNLCHFAKSDASLINTAESVSTIYSYAIVRIKAKAKTQNKRGRSFGGRGIAFVFFLNSLYKHEKHHKVLSKGKKNAVLSLSNNESNQNLSHSI